MKWIRKNGCHLLLVASVAIGLVVVVLIPPEWQEQIPRWLLATISVFSLGGCITSLVCVVRRT